MIRYSKNFTTKSFSKFQEGGEMQEPTEGMAMQEDIQPEPSATPEQVMEMIGGYEEQPTPELQNQIVIMIADLMGLGQEEVPSSMMQGGVVPFFKKGGKVLAGKQAKIKLLKKGSKKMSKTKMYK